MMHDGDGESGEVDRARECGDDARSRSRMSVSTILAMHEIKGKSKK